jgi:FecR protein
MSSYPFKLLIGSLAAASVLYGNVGKITVSNGEVSVMRAGKAIKGSSNTPIEEKDAITTKASSSAQIIFSDGTAISIGANTNFKVQEYMFDEKSNSANLKVGVSEGAFKAITGKIGKISPDKFRLETKTATIGIRGTAFLGIVPREGPETIACTKGSIAVAPLPVIVAPPAGAPLPVGAPAPAAQPAGQAPTPAAPAPGAPAPAAPTPGAPTAPAPGVAPAPIAAPAPMAPPPAPVFIEVKAGEMTTVSIGKVEAPRAFTQAEIKKLEKASSTETKKSDAPAAAGGEKKADSGGDKGSGGGGDKGGGTTATSASATAEPAKSGDAPAATGTTAATSTAATTTTTAPVSTTVALSAPVAPAVTTPIVNVPTSTIGNIANTVSGIQNTVTNVQNTVVAVQNVIIAENVLPPVAPIVTPPVAPITPPVLPPVAPIEPPVAPVIPPVTPPTPPTEPVVPGGGGGGGGGGVTTTTNSALALDTASMIAANAGQTKTVSYDGSSLSYTLTQIPTTSTYAWKNVYGSGLEEHYIFALAGLSDVAHYLTAQSTANTDNYYAAMFAYPATSGYIYSWMYNDISTRNMYMKIDMPGYGVALSNALTTLPSTSDLTIKAYLPSKYSYTGMYTNGYGFDPAAYFDATAFDATKKEWTLATIGGNVKYLSNIEAPQSITSSYVTTFGDIINDTWTHGGASYTSMIVQRILNPLAVVTGDVALYDNKIFMYSDFGNTGVMTPSNYAGNVFVKTTSSSAIFAGGSPEYYANSATNYSLNGDIFAGKVTATGLAGLGFDMYMGVKVTDPTKTYLVNGTGSFGATPTGLSYGGPSYTDQKLAYIIHEDTMDNTTSVMKMVGDISTMTSLKGTPATFTDAGTTNTYDSTGKLTGFMAGTESSAGKAVLAGLSYFDTTAGKIDFAFQMAATDKLTGITDDKRITTGLSLDVISSTPTTPANFASSYIAEDIQSLVFKNGMTISGKTYDMAFATLPDKISVGGYSQFIDDYSSWGFWQARETDTSNLGAGTNSRIAGYWVAGQGATVASVNSYRALAGSATTEYVYNGHILGILTDSGGRYDPIKLDALNHFDLSVMFGASNPVRVTQMKFGTVGGLSIDSGAMAPDRTTSGISGQPINATPVAFTTNSFAGSFLNTSETVGGQFNGMFFGPKVNSVGGNWAGQFTNVDCSGNQCLGMGVFKADRAASVAGTTPTVTIAGSASATEGGVATYTVTLSQALAHDLTVTVAYTGTTSGVLPAMGLPTTATILAGATTATFAVPVVTNDTPDIARTFNVAISNLVSADTTVALGAGVSVSTTIAAESYTRTPQFGLGSVIPTSVLDPIAYIGAASYSINTSTPTGAIDVLRYFVASKYDTSFSPFAQSSLMYMNKANGNIMQFDIAQMLYSGTVSHIDGGLNIGKLGTNGAFTAIGSSLAGTAYTTAGISQFSDSATAGDYKYFQRDMKESAGITTVATTTVSGGYQLPVASAAGIKPGSVIYLGTNFDYPLYIAAIDSNTLYLREPLPVAATAATAIYNGTASYGVRDAAYATVNTAPLSASGTMPTIAAQNASGPINFSVSSSSLAPNSVVLVSIYDGSSVGYAYPATVDSIGGVSITTQNNLPLPGGSAWTPSVLPYIPYTDTTYMTTGTWTGLKFFYKTALNNLASIGNAIYEINGPTVSTNADFTADITKASGNINLNMTTYNGGYLSVSNSLVGGVSSAYISEDIWGGKMVGGSWEGANAISNAKFFAMPDKINGAVLEYSDDYSSWGYWSADFTMNSDDKTALGWWVAGAATPTGVMDALIAAHQTYAYSGHVLGAATYLNTDGNNHVVELIQMNAANQANLNIAFGSANPVSGSVAFNTASKSWITTFGGPGNTTGTGVGTNFNGQTGLNTNGNFANNASFGFNGTPATSTGTATVTNAQLRGQYFGPAANSVGGSFSLTGTTTATGNTAAGAASAIGVFKAKR